MRVLIAAVISLGLASPAFAEVELEIGPDTTVIDGPLRPDGTIDYLAHMNALRSAGVTPENNFAVDLVRTMGDDAWSDIWSEAELVVPDLLGIEPAEIGRWPFVPPRRFVDEQTDWESVDLEFFSLPESVRQKIREGSLSQEDVDWRDYRPYGPSPDEIDAEAARQEAFEEFVRDFEDQLWDAVDHPWSPDEHPEVRQWLKRNAEALDRILSGSTSKPMFYIPLLDSSYRRDGLYQAWTPAMRHARPVGYALLARAQLAVREHKLDDAWRDLQVIYTLGDQISKLSSPLPFLVSI